MGINGSVTKHPFAPRSYPPPYYAVRLRRLYWTCLCCDLSPSLPISQTVHLGKEAAGLSLLPESPRLGSEFKTASIYTAARHCQRLPTHLHAAGRRSRPISQMKQLRPERLKRLAPGHGRDCGRVGIRTRDSDPAPEPASAGASVPVGQ